MVRLSHAARAVTFIAAMGLVCVYWMGINASAALGFTGISLATALLLISEPPYTSTAGKRPSYWRVPLAGLRWMGQRSYELYLFHIIVLGLMRDAVPRDTLDRACKLPWLIVFITLSAGVAAGVERYLSTPANRWIRRRSGTLAV